MKCIVPLAGPDIWTDKFGLRPLHQLNGEAVLKLALNGRSWRGKLSGGDFIFVVRDIPEVQEIYPFLERHWRGCMIVKLPSLTGGAMLSALAGVAIVGDDEPIIVDLADILFNEAVDIESFTPEIRMIVPVFESADPSYSYLRIENGRVTGAKEKLVISSHASAGVYAFGDRITFISAASHSLRNASDVAYKDIFFLCPMVNGVLADGAEVLAPSISSVWPVGKIFHRA